MNTKIIVALDFPTQQEALNLIQLIDPNQCALKIGKEMFTRFGPEFVKCLVKQNYKIFLDLKFHDIPNTVAQACKAAADLGVWMINVHALGGLKMMQAAKEALKLYGEKKPKLIAVTLLTSLEGEDLQAIGISLSLEEELSRLAQLTLKAGLDGVVCSAHEASLIKSLGGSDFLAVTPGIRLPENKVNDQVRIMTPKQAVSAGSDYLVIGRPITQAANPAEVIAKIIHDIS